MKKIFLLLTVLLALSCDDGNLDIASFEFEEKINHCRESEITLYKFSANSRREILMLTLTDKEIRKDTIAVAPVQVTQSGKYTVTNRVFETEVTSSYFCAIIPPIEPKVIKNWAGVDGTILVKNEAVFDTIGTSIIAWKHTIVLYDVVLKSGDESLIFNDIYLFGEYETPVN